MVIEEKTLGHWINNFYGYGSWHARIWLIGYEEGGGDTPEEVAEKVNFFYATRTQTGDKTLCDIRDLYRHAAVRSESPRANAFENLYEYRFGKDAMQHSVWRNLIAFVHGFRHKQLPDLLAYQQHTFVSPSAQNEALIRFYPLPSPHNHAWYYSWLDMPALPFLKTRKLYEEHMFQRRMDVILSNINQYKPELVLMYGMNNINALKNSVLHFYNDTKFKLVKATKGKIPQHHRGDVNGTTILITTQIPALRHNRIETGFDWEGYGRSIKDPEQK